jgi:hypothetical protein
MTNLDLIRQKCIEANPKIARRKVCDEEVCAIDLNIRLADVLLAVQKLGSEQLWIGASIRDGYACWLGVDDNNAIISFAEDKSWNLREDDLTKQSPETLAFLADLLKVEPN